jgi:protocatechuate 3,4-dioxygenase beta subunit
VESHSPEWEKGKTMPLTPKAGLTRREALGLIAVTATGGVFVAPEALAQRGSLLAKSPLLMPGAGVCTIMPEATEGPFYFDPGLERQDITEGKQGIELTVRLQAVDTSCRPLPGARVDIWHCDAEGHYSGYPGQGDGGDVDTSGEKFLRGVQRTDANGIASFKTIYPGWYRGRTTHIHFKVFPEEDSVMTGQLYFPDTLSEKLYASAQPYKNRTAKRDTFNSDDRLARRAGPGAQATLREILPVYEALLVVAVDANS